MRALDCFCVRRGEGFVVGDERGFVHEIPARPDHWLGSSGDWVLHVLDERELLASYPTVPEPMRKTFAAFVDELPLDFAPFPNAPDDVAPERTPELDQLLAHMRTYMHLEDFDHVLAVLAAGVAHRLTYDPLWLMLIGASSGGKNEALRCLGDVHDASVKDLTLAGLLGKGNTGVLPRLGNGCDALVTITDFSALLTDSTQSGPDKTNVFNALRDIYDGEYARDIHPARLQWQGRVSFVAACTPALDQYTRHADALGTRWLNFRMAERDSAQRRLAVAKTLDRTGISEKRARTRELSAAIIASARERLGTVTLPDALHDAILDDANLTAYGRASVPRAWNGEVDDAVHAEEPGRLAGQLRSFALGLLALGLDDTEVLRLVHRAAVASMPVTRAQVLAAVAGATEPVTQRYVRRATGLAHRAAKRALEDWAAIGFIETQDGGEDTALSVWTLTEEYAHVVRAVFGGGGFTVSD